MVPIIRRTLKLWNAHDVGESSPMLDVARAEFDHLI
jgi:hypothetical protein